MNTSKGKTATTTGKGLFIPQKIYDIPDIKWAEKVLLSIIFHFDESNEKRVCYASDKYFAERLGYSKRNINLSFGFFCPVRLRESSRECKIGKGAINPLADLCIPEALTQPDRAKKPKTQVRN